MATGGTALREPIGSRQAAGKRPNIQTPQRGQRPREQAELGVVDRRKLREHAQRRQARVLFFLSGSVVAAGLVVAAAGHALLETSQVRADTLQSQVASALATEQNQQLKLAELDTPSRVLAIATERFKMTTPSQVTYLEPVNPGKSVLEAHTPPALASSRGGSSKKSASKPAQKSGRRSS